MQTISRRRFVALVATITALARAEPSPGAVLKQAPARVTSWFTEPVEPAFSEIRVLEAPGRQVDKRDSARYQNDPAAMSVTLGDLPLGTYTVGWRNLSAVDGHPFSGSFVFQIGESLAQAPLAQAARPEAPEPPVLPSRAEPVLRWLELLSILAIVG